MKYIARQEIDKQVGVLAKIAGETFRCNCLPHEVKDITEWKTDATLQFYLPLLLAELGASMDDILRSGNSVYICCLPIEIDRWDYLVTPTHRTLSEDEVERQASNGKDYFSATSDGSWDNVSDWEFEAWLEGNLKTEVLSVGALTHEGKRFRTFKWLAQEPTNRA